MPDTPQTNEPKAAGAAPTKKDRSPNYPSIGPTEALQLGGKIYAEARRNPMTADMACQYMGYKNKNGASLTMLAALRRYGILVSAANGEVKISDEAHTIYIAPPDLPERKNLIAQLAMRPNLFREVLSQFPDGLPSDSLLRFRLMQQWEFSSSKAADTFIRALRDAIAVAGLANDAEAADTGSEVDAEEPAPMMQNAAIASPISQPGPRYEAPPPPSPPLPSAPRPGGMQVRTWDLGGGALATLSLPFNLSKKNVDRLRKYIEALATEAAIAWDEDDDDPVT